MNLPQQTLPGPLRFHPTFRYTTGMWNESDGLVSRLQINRVLISVHLGKCFRFWDMMSSRPDEGFFL
eukprot:5890882-Amphidinium_carterae.1